MKKRRRYYKLELVVKPEGEKPYRIIYSGYKRIRVHFNKRKKTLKAVLINYRNEKKIIEKINVESVEVCEE